MKDFYKKCIEYTSSIPYEEIPYDDVYGTYSIIKLMLGKEKEEANKHLLYTASYMEKDIIDKSNRSPLGENDFAALRCIIALNTVYDSLYPEVRERMKKFLLEENYESIYGSENHVVLFRICRFLAAEFFGEDFKNYNMTCCQVLKTDKKYLLDFITYRAKYGFGEFTSAYLYADSVFFGALYCYVKDEKLKTAAKMMLDLLTIESFNNMDNKLNTAGAMGRVYPNNICPPHAATGAALKEILYERFQTVKDVSEYLIAPFNVDKFIVDAFNERALPFEVKERKHLHSMYAWRSNIPDFNHLDKMLKAGSINKYTYWCEGYGLGGINRQDEYPVDETEDYIYAHHQQVEWSLIFPENEKQQATRIYSHHPGDFGEHNYFTGDLRCCCSKSFVTKNTALTVYDIEKEHEEDFTVLFIEPDDYDEFVIDGNYVFVKRNGFCAGIYIAKPFSLEKHSVDESIDDRGFRYNLVSRGRKNAYALHIEKAEGNLEDFIKKIKAIPVHFDEEKTELTFGNLKLSRYSGCEKEYPYVYDTPWCRSEWGEGKVYVYSPKGEHILDFNTFEVK